MNQCKQPYDKSLSHLSTCHIQFHFPSNCYLNWSLKVNNTSFVFDYKDGKYGYNTSINRGADTFHPFSSLGDKVLKVGDGGNMATSDYAIRLTVPMGVKSCTIILCCAGWQDYQKEVSIYGNGLKKINKQFDYNFYSTSPIHTNVAVFQIDSVPRDIIYAKAVGAITYPSVSAMLIY